MKSTSFSKINISLLNSCNYLLERFTVDNCIDPQMFSRLFKRAQIHLRHFSEVPIFICLDSIQYLSYEEKVCWLHGLSATLCREEELRALRTSLNSMKPLIK